MANRTNPNNANQYQLDPRQKLCWENYVNPKSETFGNATQSALAAGYEESYADTLSQSEWFCAKMWKLNATFTSERKIREILELPLNDLEGRVDIGVARIQADLAKFMTSTLGKDEGYSTKQELDHKNNGASFESVPMTPSIMAATKAYEEALKKEMLD